MGLNFVAIAFICLVSWVSECHLEVEHRSAYTPMWVIMDPPLMSLYWAVPGFFTSLIAAVISFVHSVE